METKPFETVCIVGAGTMGTDIGLQCATHGYAVWLVGPRQEALQRAARLISQELGTRVQAKRLTEDEKEDILGRIRFTSDLVEGAPSAELVIESVPERRELKRQVFSQLDAICPSHTILATNSSSMRISAIEDATHRPDKVLNLHFYPNVSKRSIVELMRGTATSEQTIERARQFARTIGMTPLIVQRERTGFVFNRVWRAIKKECLHLVNDGVASHEDIDRAWMIIFGTDFGPFGMMDEVGLDVVRDIELLYYGESGDASDLPPKLLLDNIERGELGVKTGKGFYTYPQPAFRDPRWLRGTKD
jgi:3-hydroxybutyryl-CoA dehydrogenase